MVKIQDVHFDDQLIFSEEDVSTEKDNSREIKQEEKLRVLKKLISSNKTDVAKLKQLAISPGGILNDDLRKIIWPKLLQIDVDNIPSKPTQDILHNHRDYEQVVLDVNRSLKRFPPGMEDGERMSYQDQLVDLIMRVLVKHEELHYYQGYHDICITFLLVAGEDIAFALVENLSMNHLRDFMDNNMDKTKHILNYLYPIVGQANPHLREFMEESEVGTVFSLSWLITWFGHVLNDLRHIVRLYDFFIACHPLMPIYLAAAMVLHREEEILCSECDMCVLHGLMSAIPENLPYEQLVRRAGELFLQYPPEVAEKDAASVLKTKTKQLQNYKKTARDFRRNGQTKRQRIFTRYCVENSKKIYVKMTLWTLVGIITAAGLSYLNHHWYT